MRPPAAAAAAAALLPPLLLLCARAADPAGCACDAPRHAQLNCSSRAIDSLRAAVGRCEIETQAIDASHNQLESVDCLDGRTVIDLNLSCNRIKTMTSCLLKEHLTKLDVSWNALRSLDVEEATQLKVLRANNNDLEELTLPLANCSLEEVNVVTNRLSTLPEGLENCTELFYVGIANNVINELPDAVLQLMTLPKLFKDREHDTLVDLRNNTLSAVATITGVREYAKSSGHLHMYLDPEDCECAILKNEDESLRRVKICISSMCGDGMNYWTAV